MGPTVGFYASPILEACGIHDKEFGIFSPIEGRGREAIEIQTCLGGLHGDFLMNEGRS